MAALRWGLLSTARINAKILAAAAASDSAEIVAVASRDTNRAEAYARELGIPHAHGNYEALLTDPDVDAVYISLPNHLHVDWSIRALEAGKHVLCEKPFARRLADAERAFAVADRTGLVLSEAFMWRHNPQTVELAELVSQGAIGRVERINAFFGFDLGSSSNRRGVMRIAANAKRRLKRIGKAPDVRLVPDYDGGALMDLGCYCVSAIRLLAGEPTVVEGSQTLGPTGVDLHFAGRLELAGGVEARFECGLDTANRDELEVIGTDGSLFLDDPFLCGAPVIEIRKDKVKLIGFERTDSYRRELENIADAVSGAAPLLLGRADALGQARALEALYLSATENRPVEPDPLDL